VQAKNVDATRTISNHVVEMFEVLGVEAARLSVLKEMRAVLEFDGSKVNYRCARRPPRPCSCISLLLRFWTGSAVCHTARWPSPVGNKSNGRRAGTWRRSSTS
jgi:RNA polymerase Rpb1, domain 5